MKYGLMYFKDTDNIGDDIQTYVAKRFLPHIDYYIDREALNCFIPKEKEYVSMIMNGWYIHNKCAWPPSPYINPLLMSMHFMSIEATDIGDKYLQGLGGEYLKLHEPIGARDIETKKRLEKNGIESYFSGCMTLTLERFENIEKTNKIYLVDAEKKVKEKVKKENLEFEIEEITHWLEPSEISKKSIDERLKDVENLLKKYQSAHLVITNRLHVALPCIALGTPVILVHPEYFDEDRLGTFLKYMDNYTDTEFINMDIKELLKNPKPNNEEYKEIRESLIKKCKDFIEQCESSEMDTSKLPDVQEYYNNYVSKIEWYKDLYESERQSLERVETKRVEEYRKNLKEIEDYNFQIEDYNSQIEKLNTQIESLKKANSELYEEKMNLENQNNKKEEEKQKLNNELYLVYNSKGWKCLEKIRKILRKDK